MKNLIMSPRKVLPIMGVLAAITLMALKNQNRLELI